MREEKVLPFQAEVRELLRLVVHSLYSNREIFLRELISNASDACDKLRFEALAKPELYEGDGALGVWVDYDKSSRTVTIRDNGIGMNEQEVIENLGTIARSGTKNFLAQLAEEQRRKSALIGQFGVGFYSAFIVAEEVVVRTRRAGSPPETGVEWRCTLPEDEREATFTVAAIPRAQRGTEVVLRLKEQAAEFASRWRLQELIHKYSEHILWPIYMPEEEWDKEKGEYRRTGNWTQVNRGTALWARARGEVSEEEYKNFYKHVAHDFEEPLAWVHTKVEGKHEFTLLLYLPRRAPFDLWEPKPRHGIKLYVKRVFIMEDAERLLPSYLRFVRGVVDAEDLPLNVSREMLQEVKALEAIRGGITKRVLGLLEQLAKQEPEKYAHFWREFGRVLKEGVGEDAANRERVAALLRFASTHTGSPEPTVSLDDYVGRMKEGQSKIYFLTADSYTAAVNSPHLELFRKKGIEVLLLTERIDEWWTAHLTEYQGKPLIHVTRGIEELAALADEEKAAVIESAKENAPLLERLKQVLTGKVKEVRPSARLVESPACLVVEESGMTLHLQRILQQAGQNAPRVEPLLEVNLNHPLVRRLSETEGSLFEEWALLLYEEALLAEGAPLEDPAGFVKRVNRLLLA
ncbi:MAG: molecular chaperone HtpG [Hydrogenophilus sp.]|nr:molecular chaperone HtpG [Hydrogenophilus sp.]